MKKGWYTLESKSSNLIPTLLNAKNTLCIADINIGIMLI